MADLLISGILAAGGFVALAVFLVVLANDYDKTHRDARKRRGHRR